MFQVSRSKIDELIAIARGSLVNADPTTGLVDIIIALSEIRGRGVNTPDAIDVVTVYDGHHEYKVRLTPNERREVRDNIRSQKIIQAIKVLRQGSHHADSPSSLGLKEAKDIIDNRNHPTNEAVFGVNKLD